METGELNKKGNDAIPVTTDVADALVKPARIGTLIVIVSLQSIHCSRTRKTDATSELEPTNKPA